MINEKEEIEQLKRDLYSYGYYSSKNAWCELKLNEIRIGIQDCYQASGIRYDEPMITRSPYHTRITFLIHEEGYWLSEKKSCIERQNALNMETKLKILTEKERSIIESSFIHHHTHRMISDEHHLTREGVTKSIQRSLKKIVKEKEKCTRG